MSRCACSARRGACVRPRPARVASGGGDCWTGFGRSPRNSKRRLSARSGVGPLPWLSCLRTRGGPHRGPARRAALLLRAAALAHELGRRELLIRLLREADSPELGSHDRALSMWLADAFHQGAAGDPARVHALVETAAQLIVGGDTDLALNLLLAAAFRCFSWRVGRSGIWSRSTGWWQVWQRPVQHLKIGCISSTACGSVRPAAGEKGAAARA